MASLLERAKNNYAMISRSHSTRLVKEWSIPDFRHSWTVISSMKDFLIFHQNSSPKTVWMLIWALVWPRKGWKLRWHGSPPVGSAKWGIRPGHVDRTGWRSRHWIEEDYQAHYPRWKEASVHYGGGSNVWWVWVWVLCFRAWCSWVCIPRS